MTKKPVSSPAKVGEKQPPPPAMSWKWPEDSFSKVGEPPPQLRGRPRGSITEDRQLKPPPVDGEDQEALLKRISRSSLHLQLGKERKGMGSSSVETRLPS